MLTVWGDSLYNWASHFLSECCYVVSINQAKIELKQLTRDALNLALTPFSVAVRIAVNMSPLIPFSAVLLLRTKLNTRYLTLHRVGTLDKVKGGELDVISRALTLLLYWKTSEACWVKIAFSETSLWTHSRLLNYVRMVWRKTVP